MYSHLTNHHLLSTNTFIHDNSTNTIRDFMQECTLYCNFFNKKAIFPHKRLLACCVLQQTIIKPWTFILYFIIFIDRFVHKIIPTFTCNIDKNQQKWMNIEVYQRDLKYLRASFWKQDISETQPISFSRVLRDCMHASNLFHIPGILQGTTSARVNKF